MRLGEHDTRTKEDEPHLNVPIAKVQPMKIFDKKLFLNDIGLLYLEHHVTFNGKNEEKIDFLYERTLF